MIKNIMKNIGTKPNVKAELFEALKTHKKTPGYNYSDFDEKDVEDFLETAKTELPGASTEDLKKELLARYENAARLTAPTKDESGLNAEQRKKWEEKAANPDETTASLKNFIDSMSKPEAKANPHADEIVEIYKAELEKRNKNPNYRPEKVYDK